MASTSVKRKSNKDFGPAKKTRTAKVVQGVAKKPAAKKEPELVSESGSELSDDLDASDASAQNESQDESNDSFAFNSEDEEEDELDQIPESKTLSDNDSDLEEDELVEADSDQEAAGVPEKKKTDKEIGDAKLKRKEQKVLQRERKLQKAHGAEIEQTKKLWESLRAKQGVSKQERTRLLNEITQLVDGNWKDMVFRHDASRVVQTVFKYADKALRIEITAALKGRYVDLAKSAYGKYLLVKMLHYGSPKVREEIINEMHGSFRKLMGHKEGAYVIEDTFRDFATAKQRRQIMREFYGSEFALFKNAGESKANLTEIIAENPEKKSYLLENLNKVITQAINKGSIGFEIVHAMMLEYIRNIDRDPKSLVRETFIDLIADDFVEMVHTNAGSQVASLALAISTAKERKRLLKSLRQFPAKLARDNFGTIVMIAAFMTVDDTKLTHKAFAELEAEMAELICHRFARRPLLTLLVGSNNTKYFGVLQQRFKEINEFKKDFSKKDDEARRLELLNAFLPAMYATVKEQTSELVKENLGIQFVGELFLNAPELDEEALTALLATYDSDPALNKNHALNVNPMSGRVAKLLVRSNAKFAEELNKLVMKYPVSWTKGEGCFTVVSLLETLKGDSLKQLRDVLKANMKEISKSEAKGIQLLLTLVKGA